MNERVQQQLNSYQKIILVLLYLSLVLDSQLPEIGSGLADKAVTLRGEVVVGQKGDSEHEHQKNEAEQGGPDRACCRGLFWGRRT